MYAVQMFLFLLSYSLNSFNFRSGFVDISALPERFFVFNALIKRSWPHFTIKLTALQSIGFKHAYDLSPIKNINWLFMVFLLGGIIGQT